MDVDSKKSNGVTLSHARLPVPHRTVPRLPQPSLARYTFTYNELYQVLFQQNEVKNVKLEDIKGVQPASPDKKLTILKNNDTVVSCEMCRGQPKQECKEHAPLLWKHKELSYAISSFPDEVQLCWSSIPGAGYGVSAKQPIPIGTWIGPYEGHRTRPEDVTKDIDTSYMWEIFQEGRLACYLDASDENTSSWMRFIRCARHRDEQNLYAFQYCGNIYYRAFRNIQIGQELIVWYDDKYQQHMGLPLNIQDMAIVDPNGNKLLFDMMAFNVQPPVTQSKPHVTQSIDATKLSPTDVAPRTSGLDSRHHVTANAFHHSHSKGAVPRIMPVTQHQTKVTQCKAINVTHPILVSCTTKYPIVVTAPVSTVVMETKQTNEGSIRKTPISVTNSTSSLVTQSISIVKQISPSKRKKLHDQNVPIQDIKHLKTAHHAHAQEVRPQTDIPYGLAMTTKQLEIAGSTGDDNDRDMFDNGEKNMWNCGQCQRSFTQRALLQIHVCQGMPNRPYKCGQCEDSFSQSNDLRTHVVKHSNDKLFKCGYCSRSFAGATTLDNHIRTHTGVKAFSCSKCRKTFSTASQLNKHQKTPSECIQ